MPASCCKPDYDAAFDARDARRQLTAYRRSGPKNSTRRLLDAIRGRGVDGASVLDIGSGIGVIGIELLRAGALSVTDVDASRSSMAVAQRATRAEAGADRASFHHGDFVELADEIGDADIVTLDRVVCCYGDWLALIDRSTAHARRLYGLVIPNDRWYLRLAIGVGNLWLRVIGQTFRGYVHPEHAIDARIRSAGFERRLHHRGWVWQTALYERVSGASVP